MLRTEPRTDRYAPFKGDLDGLVREGPADASHLGAFRAGSPHEIKQTPKKGKHGGHMFVQGIMGERVIDEDGAEIFKLSFVSFNLPNLFDKNHDIVRALSRQNPFLARLADRAVSYTDDDSLVMSLVSSMESIDQRSIGLMPSLYKVARRMVKEQRRGIPEENFESFLSQHRDRESKVEMLFDDTFRILFTPGHTGETAYRNHQIQHNFDRRMELIFKDGVLMTPGPPNTGYKMFVFDETIAMDEGDKKSILALLEFIKEAYASGAKTIFGLQVNNTATVEDCGAKKHSDIFAQDQTLDTSLQNPLDPGSNTMNNAATAANAATAESQGTASATSGSGDGEGTAQSRCQGCGKSMPNGILICTCGSVAAHIQKNAA
jgi:hypothetical protein